MYSKETLRAMGERYPQIAPTLIFKFANTKDGITDLMKIYLAGSSSNLVSFEDRMLIAAILSSGDWFSEQNCEVRVRFRLGIGLKNEDVLEVISNARNIESIKFANQNPLNGLMTRREKIQKDVAREILEGCLTQNIINEAENWGLSINGELHTPITGLPGIRFGIAFENKTVSTIILDGWSGCILVDGKIQDVAFSGYEQIHGILSNAIETSIERLAG